MDDLWNRAVRFLRDDDGPTTVEYAMMIMLVFLAILTTITALGGATAESFDNSTNSIEDAFGSGR